MFKRNSDRGTSARGRGRKFLVLIWCVFLARGVFYSTFLPIWEGYDEPIHFAFVQYLDTTHRLPLPTTPVSREIQSSLHLLPLPWTLRLHGYPKPIFTHDEFWELDVQQRDHLEQEFRRIPKEWASEPGTELIRNYEAQQPPLYYVLLAAPLQLTANLTLPSRILVLRLLSVIVASLLVPLGYLVSRKILGNEMSALGIVALATVMPELMINISRVANESLAIALYTLLVYLTLKVVDSPEHFGYLPGVGVVLGFGLLTKAYFLTALPALFVILVWCRWRWRSHWKRLILQSALGIGTAVAIGGVWYWRAHRMMGSWSGLYSDAAIGGMSKWGLLRQVFHVNWISALISVLLSHTWYGAWSFLRVSNIVYTVFGAVMLLAAAGLLRLSVKLWASSSGEEESWGNYLRVLICFYGFFWLGLAYQTLTLFVSEGSLSFHRLVHVLPRRTGTDLGLLRSANHVSVFPASRYSSWTNCSFCIARRVQCALLTHPLLFRDHFTQHHLQRSVFSQYIELGPSGSNTAACAQRAVHYRPTFAHQQIADPNYRCIFDPVADLHCWNHVADGKQLEAS